MIAVQNIESHFAPEIKGIRVTPHVYATLGELVYFCEVIEKAAKQGLPK